MPFLLAHWGGGLSVEIMALLDKVVELENVVLLRQYTVFVLACTSCKMVVSIGTVTFDFTFIDIIYYICINVYIYIYIFILVRFLACASLQNPSQQMGIQ